MTLYLFKDTALTFPNTVSKVENLFEWWPNYITRDDLNLVQINNLSSFIIDGVTEDDIRNVDFAVIEDGNNNKYAYYVDKYIFNADDTVTFQVSKEPYLSFGGFEPGSGNIIVSGSACRISVPIDPVPGMFPITENNTFFTLTEPFQPALRLVTDYVQATPTPTPPTPTPTPLDFRYPANNICSSGQGFRRLTVGSDAGKFATTGDAGEFSLSKDVSANRYLKIEVLSNATGAYDFFETKSQFVEAMFNSANAALLRLKYQIEELPAQNQKFATDLTNAILPAIQGLFNDWKSTTPTNTTAEYMIQVTPQYVHNSQSHYIDQRDDGSENPTEIGEVSAWGNPFSQTEGYWYRLRVRVACCTDGTEYYDVCEDGRIVKEA